MSEEAAKPMPEDRGSMIRGPLRSAALSLLGRLVREPNGPFLRCLYFHGVADSEAANFSRLIAELARMGTFVDTGRMLSMLEGAVAARGGCFHLSFDDGYRNLLRNSFPVLRELKIPAVVFVVTGKVGCDPADGPDQRLMSWDELRQIRAWGFEVASHTKTHPQMSRVASSGDLEAEVSDSKRAIEEQLACPCRYIAWPGGRLADVDERFFDAVRAAGYQACFGGFRGSVAPGRTDRFCIPRHHLEAPWPLSHIRYFATGHGE